MWQRIRPNALDVGLTLGLGMLFLVSTLASSDEGRSLGVLGWLLFAANTLPLLGLRHNPLAVALTLCAAYPAWAALEFPTHIIQSLPTLAALGATGAAPRPLWWRAIALLTPIEMMGAALMGIWDVDLLEIGYIAIVFAVVWALGVALGSRRDHARALTEKTVALQEAREELARRAVSEERTRIARDLHDIVAHAMSVITVQAGVGAHLIKRSPEKAEAALRAIEETGRGALDDMRRMLGALRSDELSTQPQPTLNSLDLLVANVESAGTPVQVTIEGAARPLPAGLELTAYRIAQEALTNSVKHAPGARASLTLRYGPDDIAIEIVDSGGLPDPAPNDGGHGLKGMRERVELYGGLGGSRSSQRWLPRGRNLSGGRSVSVRVLVVDDQELVRAGFVALLESDPDIEVAGEAPDGSVAVELAGRSDVDVVLLDIRMPVMDGIKATRALRDLPDPPEVVILTTFDTDDYVYEAFSAGASGFLVKDTPPVELLRAVHHTADGGTVISPGTARRLLRDLVAARPDERPTPEALETLTERELEVLTLIARGLSNAQIAERLVISELTAKTHVSRILMKLNLLSRVHAVVFAYETGLITPGSG